MATLPVLDANGATVAIEKPLTPGRAAATASRPVAFSNEDLAAINAITTALGTLGTQTTLAAILAKLIATPATEAKQDSIIAALASVDGHVDGLEASATALNAKDFATQTTLAAVLAKMIAAPATEAKQDTLIGYVDNVEALLTALNGLVTTQAGYLDNVEGLIGAQNTLVTTQNTYLDGVEGSLSSILAKLIVAPATEAKQDALITYVDGIETLIGSTNTAIAATNALLTTQNGYVDTLEALITATNTAVGSTNTLLTTQNGYLDNVETLITATNTALTTQAAYLDGLEGLLGTNNTLLTTQNTYLDGVETLVGSTNTALALLHTDAIAATPAGENHIGSVTGNTTIVNVDLTLSTVAYSPGDLLADTQEVTNAMRVVGGAGTLQSIQVLDDGAQAAAFDLVFLDVNTSMGVENSAPSITDALAQGILGFISINTYDYLDTGVNRIATKTNCGLGVKAATGTRHVYVAAITHGTPTYAATGLHLRLTFLQD